MLKCNSSKDEIDINELIYLLLLTRKPLTEVEQDMVQRIVERMWSKEC